MSGNALLENDKLSKEALYNVIKNDYLENPLEIFKNLNNYDESRHIEIISISLDRIGNSELKDLCGLDIKSLKEELYKENGIKTVEEVLKPIYKDLVVEKLEFKEFQKDKKIEISI